jgi:hypothetical protein
MYNENTKGILNLFDLRIHKSIVESNLLLEFAEMKGNKNKIKSNGDTWIYYDFYKKLIEISNLKIEKLNLELEQINLIILKKSPQE